jgi:hypothetical protein
VSSYTPFSWRHPRLKRRSFGVCASRFNPSAAILRLLFVWWIADNHHNRLAPLDLVRFTPRLGDRAQNRWEPFLLYVRIAQRVRNEHSQGCAGRLSSEVGDLSEYPQLGNRERTKLNLKADEATNSGINRGWYCSRPLIFGDRISDSAQCA